MIHILSVITKKALHLILTILKWLKSLMCQLIIASVLFVCLFSLVALLFVGYAALISVAQVAIVALATIIEAITTGLFVATFLAAPSVLMALYTETAMIFIHPIFFLTCGLVAGYGVFVIGLVEDGGFSSVINYFFELLCSSPSNGFFNRMGTRVALFLEAELKGELGNRAFLAIIRSRNIEKIHFLMERVQIPLYVMRSGVNQAILYKDEAMINALMQYIKQYPREYQIEILKYFLITHRHAKVQELVNNGVVFTAAEKEHFFKSYALSEENRLRANSVLARARSYMLKPLFDALDSDNEANQDPTDREKSVEALFDKKRDIIDPHKNFIFLTQNEDNTFRYTLRNTAGKIVSGNTRIKVQADLRRAYALRAFLNKPKNKPVCDALYLEIRVQTIQAHVQESIEIMQSAYEAAIAPRLSGVTQSIVEKLPAQLQGSLETLEESAQANPIIENIRRLRARGDATEDAVELLALEEAIDYDNIEIGFCSDSDLDSEDRESEKPIDDDGDIEIGFVSDPDSDDELEASYAAPQEGAVENPALSQGNAEPELQAVSAKPVYRDCSQLTMLASIIAEYMGADEDESYDKKLNEKESPAALPKKDVMNDIEDRFIAMHIKAVYLDEFLDLKAQKKKDKKSVFDVSDDSEDEPDEIQKAPVPVPAPELNFDEIEIGFVSDASENEVLPVTQTTVPPPQLAVSELVKQEILIEITSLKEKLGNFDSDEDSNDEKAYAKMSDELTTLTEFMNIYNDVRRTSPAS